jgi:phage tail sheath gpL-like
MAISLLGLPSNWRAPGTYIANQPASGGGTVGLLPTMILGQMLTGTAVPNVPIQVFSKTDVNTLFGANSMVAAMFQAYRLNDPTGAIYVCPLQDNISGTQSSAGVTFAGTATAAGSIALYVNNVPIPTAVTVGMTATAVAISVAVAVNAMAANPNVVLPVSASATGAVLTITNLHKGFIVGTIPVSINKNGPSNGEFLLAGITAVVNAPVAGTTDPDLTGAITNITPLPWSFLVCPYNTTVANAQINTLLSDLVGRWSPTQQTYGVSFNAFAGTLSATSTYVSTFGAAANKHMTTLGTLDGQSPAYVAAAIFGGLAAVTSRSNPALPIVGQLQGLDAPSLVNRLRRTDENTLLFSGVSAIRVDGSGNPRLSRAVQNYTSDTNYLNIETDFLVEYADMYIRSDLENKYAQVSLLADGSPISAGSGATSPSLILSHCWGLYLDLVDLNVVQQPKQFIAGSFVEANISAGVVSLFLPIITAAQLRVIKVLVSFS